ncbi:site-2 protease family protein [Candidatus Shikimatogenerans silvanidophilus]|uniref:site-2 protease family protein n=1 Tax=Candidatus Shikimatogenerans silvanidophilus TaxID=2782547 RepID=UPI001BADCBC2|nr:site-2 protease family protein [Candidatus Shikimatogenerans silvanidophilus]
MFIKIIQLFISLIIIIFVHEIGHFIIAKILKFKVKRFFIFLDIYFSIFKKKIGNTIYGIGWLPLGGYVKIKEMNFENKEYFKKLLLSIGGIFNNFLLSFILYFIFYKKYYYYDNFVKYNNGNYNNSNGIEIIESNKYKYTNFYPLIFKKKIKNGDIFCKIYNKKINYLKEIPIKFLLGKKILIKRKNKFYNIFLSKKYNNIIKNFLIKNFFYNRKKIKYIIPKKNYYSEKLKIKKGDIILKIKYYNKNKIIIFYDDLLSFFKKINKKKLKNNNYINNINIKNKNKKNFIIIFNKNNKNNIKKINNINFLKLKNSFFLKIESFNIKKKKISTLDSLYLSFLKIKYLIFNNFFLIKNYFLHFLYIIKIFFIKNYNFNDIKIHIKNNIKNSIKNNINNKKYNYKIININKINNIFFKKNIIKNVKKYKRNRIFNFNNLSKLNIYSKIIINKKNNKYILYILKFFEKTFNLKKILKITAKLSINIGCFNLIPIPSFDGFYILLFLIELIINRNISKEIIYKILTISFLLLITLSFLSFFKNFYFILFN